MPTENLRSDAAYRRNLAYRHIHRIPMTATRVCIHGEGCHKVNHRDSSPARKKIDARERRKVARRRGRKRTTASVRRDSSRKGRSR